MIIGGVATAWGIFNYSKDKASLELVPCCTVRDNNCHCTDYVWKKSSDCETVPCPGAHTQPTEVKDNLYVFAQNLLKNNGGAGGMH